MGLGAIVVIEARGGTLARTTGIPASAAGSGQEALFPEPLAYVEVAGRSTTERLIERLLLSDVDFVSVLVEAPVSGYIPPFRGSHDNVIVEVVSDVRSAITEKLKDFSECGIEHSFINSAHVYTETDLLDLFYFHREARQTATRAFAREGPLALWVVDCGKAQYTDLEDLLAKSARSGSSYFIREYVNLLNHPRDLRRFAADILRGRSKTTPSGRQIRPGVWMDNDADVHRRARIVAPAYIGAGCKIRDAALITRCSTIESASSVDCGTVVEDSSVLPNTNIGIWLDVCHAVVKENKLLSLGRDVVIEISDPNIIRAATTLRRAGSSVISRVQSMEQMRQQISPVDAALDLPGQRRTADAWQFGANLIEE